MTRDEAVQLIQTSGGKIMGLEFIKRSDGSVRHEVTDSPDNPV